MKRITPPFAMALALAALPFGAGPAGAHGNEKHAAKPASARAASAKPPLAATNAFRAGLGDVYEGYLGIRNALVKDDLTAAQQAFNAMHARLHGLPTDGLAEPSLAYWKEKDAELMEILHSMASSKSTQAMRKHFAEFSPILKEVFDRFGVRTKEPF